ncbi:MAG: UDP-glucose/GDP-mannose dehydrogenase family protein, partial [Tannerellaceae bacterium]|nr:UDP-glucose/GDP-mannose dehydrogenase family protein [Tannerellaceae bacterium]
CCVDIDKEKIDKLNQGIIPIYEPGLEEMVNRNRQTGRMSFTTSLPDCLPEIQVLFCAVGTPPDEDGSADLKHVLAVAREIGQKMEHYLLVVTKSTVPVGTAEKIRQTILDEQQKRGVSIPFDIASNPEFLKEGAAIKDFMSPDRVVVGVDSQKAKEIMSRLYRPFLLNNFRVIFMDIPSAEMTKYAANAMLATRISFMNDIANLCELVGADVNMVRKGIGSDSRIGQHFLYPGCGYGGSCFPKDVKAIIRTAQEKNYDLKILKAVEEVNTFQKTLLFRKLNEYYQQNLSGRQIALWGLAFKPETDDIREAPSLEIIKHLLQAGSQVKVYDPVAMEEIRKLFGDRISYAKDMYEAVMDCDALMIVTEWKTFRLPSWKAIHKLMAHPVVFDGRNIYDPQELTENGFIYHCIGK